MPVATTSTTRTTSSSLRGERQLLAMRDLCDWWDGGDDLRTHLAPLLIEAFQPDYVGERVESTAEAAPRQLIPWLATMPEVSGDLSNVMIKLADEASNRRATLTAELRPGQILFAVPVPGLSPSRVLLVMASGEQSANQALFGEVARWYGAALLRSASKSQQQVCEQLAAILDLAGQVESMATLPESLDRAAVLLQEFLKADAVAIRHQSVSTTSLRAIPAAFWQARPRNEAEAVMAETRWRSCGSEWPPGIEEDRRALRRHEQLATEVDGVVASVPLPLPEGQQGELIAVRSSHEKPSDG